MTQEPDYEDAPKTKTETSRSSGDGKYPPTRTAIGAADGGSQQYEAEEELQCEVVGFRDGGFVVRILKDGNQGFLKSDRHLKLGQILIAKFYSWQDRR